MLPENVQEKSIIVNTNQERGLVIISALLNFVDYLEKRSIITHNEQRRGELIREFLESHSPENNYFMCAEDIAKRLGVPFENAGKL